MKYRSTWLLLAVVVMAMMAPRASEAGGFSFSDYEGGFALGKWEGTLEGGYEWEDQTSQTPGTPEFTVFRDRRDEDLQIANRGFYLLDPRLLTGSAGLNLDFFQEQDRLSGNQNNSQHGTLVGYDFSSSILSDKPYTATFFANQTQNVSNSDFAGRTETSSSNLGAVANLREQSILREMGFPYFTSQLELTRGTTNESNTVQGRTFKLDETRDNLTYQADKGYETADLGFRYQLTNVSQTGTNDLSYANQQIDLNYSKDFGPNLNRRWDSRISYSNRTGNTGNDSSLWIDEGLRIDHYENLYSNYRYLLTRNDNEGAATTNQDVTASVGYRLYRNLTNELTAEGRLTTLPQGRQTMYAGQWNSHYQRKLPWSGNFFLTTGGRYEVDDNNLSNSQISVVDEMHTAVSVGFTLNNPFVVVSSIVIYDTQTGRVPTTPGVDYDIVAEGNLTQIFPLPTSTIIKPLDPLAVTYDYQVAPSIRYSTLSKFANVGVSFPWVELFFAHEDYKQTLLSGSGNGFLENRDDNTARLDLHREWGPLTARAGGSYEILDSTNLSYKRKMLEQNLSLRSYWGIMLNMGANESWTDFTQPVRRQQVRDFRVSADRYGWGGGYTSLFADMRTIEDTEVPTQDDREAGVRARWILGKLTIAPQLSWRNRTWGGTKSDDLRIELRITRRFERGY